MRGSHGKLYTKNDLALKSVGGRVVKCLVFLVNLPTSHS